MNQYVTVGKVGKSHGVKGYVKIYSFTDPYTQILNYQPWQIQQGTKRSVYPVENSKIISNQLTVKFGGIDSPESAKTLLNTEILIDRNQLPKLPKGNYYWVELEGLQVKNQREEGLGSIKSIFNNGAHDILVVEQNNEEHLIPYLKHVITEVNLDQGFIKVHWEKL